MYCAECRVGTHLKWGKFKGISRVIKASRAHFQMCAWNTSLNGILSRYQHNQIFLNIGQWPESSAAFYYVRVNGGVCRTEYTVLVGGVM